MSNQKQPVATIGIKRKTLESKEKSFQIKGFLD
jgi:hypothetical protein